MKPDSDYLLRSLIQLLEIPSPTGHTTAAIEKVESLLEELYLEPVRTNKGGLVATLKGNDSSRPRALTAHVDTLGAMVKSIQPNGRLELSKIGGFAWNTVEGEGCTIFTQSGDSIRGSLLLKHASSHVHGTKVGKAERSDSNMEIRLDALTDSEDETQTLGIAVGDFVAFDPRVERSNSGYVRSRHLDDKAGCACLLAAIQTLQSEDTLPSQTTTIHFSNYEEVGHGASSGFPEDLVELVTVDMAAIGEGQSSDEHHVTICAKDSGGPYHEGITSQLRRLASENSIPYKVDIYPYYGSDGEAFWRAGGDVQVALVGPGVDASHNYERTHIDSLIATTRLLISYLLN